MYLGLVGTSNAALVDMLWIFGSSELRGLSLVVLVYALIALRSLSTFGRMAHVCAVSRGSHDLLAQDGYTK